MKSTDENKTMANTLNINKFLFNCESFSFLENVLLEVRIKH